MIYRRFWIVSIGYVVAITLLALGFAFFVRFDPVYSLVFLFLLIIIAAALVRWINLTNDKLAFFFNAIRNDETSFRFPDEYGFLKEKEFHRSLNQLNEKLRNARISIEVQERFYKSIMENVRTGIISFSENGVVEFANPAVLRMFGIEHISHISRFERFDRKLPEILIGLTPGESRRINVRAGQNLLSLAIQAQSIVLQQHRLKLVTMQDIRSELDKQEMDSWQKLISILNHEIMNSVTPITSLSSTISGFYKKDGKEIDPASVTPRIISDTVKGLNIIEEHGSGLIKFVESYRSLTRLPKPEFAEINLKEFLERVLILANSFFTSELEGERPEIVIEVDPDELSMLADEKLLARVLLNLIKNSTEAFTKPSGNLISIRATCNIDGRPVIMLKDNGPGMEPEILEKIFVPFYTTKDTGSGIGLSLSRQILRMHNASISCDSKPGEGASFIMNF
ncbi:MAG TPA: ATP-binding protein [Bacteroidales bacterium]|nr:ATP-binding protein [Bacteroidales bacterium]